MPLYEYGCATCGKTTEKLAKSGQETIPCPACGGTAKRLVSVFSSTTGNASTSGGCRPGSGFT